MSKMRWVALAWFLAVGTVGVDGSDARAGGEPCKLATKGDSIVSKACADPKNGGVGGARKLMKEMLKVVNSGRSEKIECTACHAGVDDNRYDTLTKDGRDRFKAFVAEYDRKK
jgi:hypothetical protein